MSKAPAPTSYPQRTLVPCAVCGLTVLRAVWQGDLQRWKKFPLPVEPFSGRPHDCATARARWEALTLSEKEAA